MFVTNMLIDMPGGDIRMGILHIMREYGCKEGHRPGMCLFVSVS
jgi:hypothetical protein